MDVHGRGCVFFEKTYLVKKSRVSDVLCDTYIVQKNDWVLRIFRQRGEISSKDFPRFLEIFKILNSDVQDINTIYPGQEILIPLRIITPDFLEGQESGIITLPCHYHHQPSGDGGRTFLPIHGTVRGPGIAADCAAFRRGRD
jgi:hypothetical protein